MISSKLIKEAALAAGADVFKIAPMSRFNGAPDEINPQFLFPKQKAVQALFSEFPAAFSEKA